MRNAQRIHVVLAGLAAMVATNAHAWVFVDLWGGTRTGQLQMAPGDKSMKTIQGTEYGISTRLDPIPMVPVSFGFTGIGYSYPGTNANKGALSDELLSASEVVDYDLSAEMSMAGLVVGPDIMVWFPMPFVQPYAHAGWVWGTETQQDLFTAESKTGVTPDTKLQYELDSLYTTRGNNLAFGVRLKPVRFFGAFLEYAMHWNVRTRETTTGVVHASVDGTSVSRPAINETDGKTETDHNASSLRFGLQFGW